MTNSEQRVRHDLTGGAPAVEARGLTKVFQIGRRTMLQRLRREPDRREDLRAVDAIDLRVERGEIFGVLGPNGAGKTTTLRMLGTLLIPTAGEARVLGFDVIRQPNEVRRRLGAVLAGERSTYWKLTARENLEYFAALYAIPRSVTASRIEHTLRAMELYDRADDYVERFSTGMRQRLVLARALLPDPELLLIDEPTVGLDPQSAAHLRERISRLRDEGRTILLTTHYMEEADQLCDRIAIVDGGKIAALGTPSELKRTIRAEQVVRLRLTANGTTAAFVDGVRAAGVVAHREEVDGELSLTLHCASAPDFVPHAFDVARATKSVIRHVELVPVSLEEVFLTITGKALRE
jgi:ABC-2 type transport system ATP-binding protein